MSIMSWDKSNRPSKPQRGVLKTPSAMVSSKKRGGGSTSHAGVRYCASSAGAKSRCDAFPKAKLTPEKPQDSDVSSSMFTRKKDGGFTAAARKHMCKGAGPNTCRAQLGYSNGRRVLRFCTAAGKPGHVIDVHGKSPEAVRTLAKKACASYTKRGKYTPEVERAALGGVKRKKKRRRR